MGDECLHNKGHKIMGSVAYLEDTGRFMVDVRLECVCGRPFQFLGLPMGLNMDGAAIDVDGTTARLAIAPVGTVPQPLDGALGFRVKPSHGDH